MNYLRLICCLILIIPAIMPAQERSIQRLDPPFWWTEMADPSLEILIYGNDLAGSQVSLDYPGVVLNGVTQVENPNYLFLTLTITDHARPGLIPIAVTKNNQTTLIQYELRQRDHDRPVPVGSEDLIYLIMPDRFANGNTGNDNVPSTQQPESDRTGQYQRHGGDIQGIIEHLDYLEDLGVTTLWLNPVEINDQPEESYHGYAATDHYRVDPRLGGNEAYAQLVDSCHARDMKVIRDVVYNHAGDQHWFLKDLPSSDWVNQWPEFTQTSYRAPTLIDPYASQADQEIMSRGWFDHHMPDLNQENPHVAAYLIQNSIWWIENFGVNGYRIDTYAYPDQRFMAKWAEAILAEYPGFTFFGEAWVHGVPVQSWFTDGIPNKPFDSHMKGVTDFQLQYAIQDALNQEFGWTEGLAKLYYVLAQDYVYEDPWANVIFLDNHDISRFYAVVNEDLDKMKMATAFLLTTRGIPQIYYGTEILMREPFDWSNHDKVRLEFPGGWPGDETNKFEQSGRTAEENEYFNYFRKLARYRKHSPALTKGSLTQFVPVDGVYVYARIHEEQQVLVILNQNNQEVALDMSRFEEITGSSGTGRDIQNGQTYLLTGSLNVPGKGALVLEIVR